MKPWAKVGLGLVMTTAVGLSACAPQVGEAPRSDEPAVISASDLLTRMHEGSAPFLLDVREPEELRGPEGVLPGVKNIPLGQISEHVDEIPRDQEVVVICRSGARSHSAIQWLQSQGYTRLRNLEGGMLAVRALDAKPK
jgi:rhodanese-related sulfurtransferase